MEEPKTFEEFWPYYLSQHSDPRCRAMHLLGTSLGIGCVGLALWWPPALLASPVVGYGMSWIGHFVFEKNRPASWHSARHFVWSFRGDMRMLGRMLRGTLRVDG